MRPGDENTKHAAHEPLISRGDPCGRHIGRAILQSDRPFIHSLLATGQLSRVQGSEFPIDD